jgi:hypothetical protein
MPRKSRLPKLRIATARRLSDFTVTEVLSFCSAWMPPREWQPWRRTLERWPDWPTYLHDWEQVRSEWLSIGLGPQPPFADRVRSFRRCFGDEALEQASYEQLHDHDPDDDD